MSLKAFYKIGVYTSATLLVVGALSACKSNTALNRGIAGLTTKFNIHFNGEDQYRQALKSMEESTTADDYSVQLQLHPVYALTKQKEPNSNFSAAFDKCKKCVQTKSLTTKPKRKAKNTPEYKLWLKRDEYNPYMHNAWLLSARCQFYDGDFGASEATYRYTARHFWWKPLAQAECHIWSARGQTVRGYQYEAESELELTIPQKQFNTLEQLKLNPVFQQWPIRLQREYALTHAQILLLQPERHKEAIPYLKFARKAWQTRAQRIRSDFYIAQLYEEAKQFDDAGREYGRIIHRAHDYKTQFNARIAQVRTMARSQQHRGNLKSITKVEKKLNRMRHQARNGEYLDQIYTALGDAAIMRHDTAKAIRQYELAVEKSTRGGMEKAMAALRLGELTFQQADYVKAQQAYSTVMGIIKDDYKDYKEISRLSAVLDELQTHAETVQLQDSLLRLSQLGEAELNKVIDQIIKDLKKKEREEADAEALAAYNERNGQNADPLAQSTTQPTVGKQDKSWYFYNPAIVNAGKSEFQRKWGARKPEDDWRRKNKTETIESLSTPPTDDDSELADNTSEPANQTNEGGTATPESGVDTPAIADSLASDPHNREYYLAQIPRTPEERDNAHQLIEASLYNEGVIINEKLENFPLAIKTFCEMERRYPESVYRLEAYYAIFLMYMRTHDQANAEIWRQKIISTFPESAYGIAVANPDFEKNLRSMAQGQDSLYISTYTQYLRASTDSVHQAYYFVHDTWTLSPLMPKFLFLHALSYIQEGDQQSFQSALEQLTATYPESDVSPLASLMVKGLREGRQAQMGAVTRGMMWGASLRQSGGDAEVDTTATFIDDDDVPHLLLLAFKTDSINQNDLLFEIAKFNFENYLTRDFELEIINTGGGISVLVISGFNNLNDLLRYHDRMDGSQTLDIPDGLYMIDISDPNFRALLGGKTFDEYFKWVEETYN